MPTFVGMTERALASSCTKALSAGRENLFCGKCRPAATIRFVCRAFPLFSPTCGEYWKIVPVRRTFRLAYSSVRRGAGYGQVMAIEKTRRRV